jgi:hypothetical protein
MVAGVQRRKMPSIVNTANRGAIPDLRDTDVVEVTCMVDEHGAHPLAQGHLRPAALELIEPIKAYERLTVEAAVEGSYAKALEALTLHPLVGSEHAGAGHPRRLHERASKAPRSRAPLNGRPLALTRSALRVHDGSSNDGAADVRHVLTAL